jgi:predicted alpha/beta superfamily hydrolase
MGHSLGGYFVLYSLLRHAKDRSVFNNYVAASPSLSYHDGYLLKEFKKLTGDLNDTKLYLTTGELEITDSKANSFNSFYQILEMKNFLRLKPVIYKNLEHMGTAIPSFEDGIEFVLGK